MIKIQRTMSIQYDNQGSNTKALELLMSIMHDELTETYEGRKKYMIEKQRSKLKIAVAYCRYSSDMQREESIESQLRALEDYANRNGFVIVKQYNRPVQNQPPQITDQRFSK